MTAPNLFAGLPATAIPEERIDALLETAHVRIERIVSTGQATPPGQWYEQDHEEWVVVLRGRAALRFEDERVVHELGPGDHVLIAARRRHRVEWTEAAGPTVWLAVHCGPS